MPIFAPPYRSLVLNVNCGSSSFGRARPCQGRGGRFEPGLPLRSSSCRLGGGFFLGLQFRRVVIGRNVPINIGGFSFDSAVTVLEYSDFNLIHHIFKEAKYAYGLGLVYRERDSLNIENGLVTNGVEFRQTIIDYSPR